MKAFKYLVIALFFIDAVATADQGRGGGFFMKAPERILRVAKEVSNKIREVDPALLEQVFPQLTRNGMSAERFANLIAKPRINETDSDRFETYNGVKRLKLLDYGTDANGPYIEALRPYLLVLEGSGVGRDDDVSSRLVHEASHHLGIVEESKSSHFTRSFLWAIHYLTKKSLPEANQALIDLGTDEYLKEGPVFLRTSGGPVYFRAIANNPKKCKNAQVMMLPNFFELPDKYDVGSVFSIPSVFMGPGELRINWVPVGGNQCLISLQVLDANGNPIGAPQQGVNRGLESKVMHFIAPLEGI